MQYRSYWGALATVLLAQLCLSACEPGLSPSPPTVVDDQIDVPPRPVVGGPASSVKPPETTPAAKDCPPIEVQPPLDLSMERVAVAIANGGKPEGFGCLLEPWVALSDGWYYNELVPLPGGTAGMLVGSSTVVYPVDDETKASLVAALSEMVVAGGGVGSVSYFDDGRGDLWAIEGPESNSCRVVHRNDYESHPIIVPGPVWRAVDTLLLDGTNLPVFWETSDGFDVAERGSSGFDGSGNRIHVVLLDNGRALAEQLYTYSDSKCSFEKLANASSLSALANPKVQQ